MPRSCASEALRKSHGRKGEGGADLYKYRRIALTRSLRHKWLRSRPLPTGEQMLLPKNDKANEFQLVQSYRALVATLRLHLGSMVKMSVGSNPGPATTEN